MSTQNPFAAFSENAEEADEVVKKTTGPSLTSLERIIKSSEQGKKRKVRPEEKKRLDEEKKKKNLTEIKEEETTTKKEKRIYDRKSGTGRGKEIAKDGAGGKHTWQNDTQYTKTEEENYYDTYTPQYKGYTKNYYGYNGGRYYSNRYYKNYYSSNGNYYKKYNNGYGNNYYKDQPTELKEVEVTETAPAEKEVEVKEEEKIEEKIEPTEEKETKEEGKKQKKKNKKEKKPEKEEVKKEDLLVLPENSQTLDEYLKSKGKSTLISENVKPVQVDPSLLPKSDIKKKDEALSIGLTEGKKEKKQKQKAKKMQNEEIDLNKMSAIQYDLDDTRKPRYFEQKEDKKEFKKEFVDKKESNEEGYKRRGYNNNHRYNNRNYYSNKNDYNYNY